MNNNETTKWMPFNSVINGHETLSNIMKEKNKTTMPTLSEDQIITLENKITEAYKKKIEIILIYYQKGNFHKLEGQITKLDSINKMICINFNSKINFNNIIDILEKNT